MVSMSLFESEMSKILVSLKVNRLELARIQNNLEKLLTESRRDSLNETMED